MQHYSVSAEISGLEVRVLPVSPLISSNRFYFQKSLLDCDCDGRAANHVAATIRSCECDRPISMCDILARNQGYDGVDGSARQIIRERRWCAGRVRNVVRADEVDNASQSANGCHGDGEIALMARGNRLRSGVNGNREVADPVVDGLCGFVRSVVKGCDGERLHAVGRSVDIPSAKYAARASA